MSTEIPKGSRFVSCLYDRRVVGTNRKTGKPVPPPFSVSYMCPPETVATARSMLEFMNGRLGWLGEIVENPIVKEDF
jgi:hypothetical protein